MDRMLTMGNFIDSSSEFVETYSDFWSNTSILYLKNKNAGLEVLKTGLELTNEFFGITMKRKN